MKAILSSLLQDGLTESALGDWATYAALPPRALDKDLGGRAPVGFWDPTDFNEDGRAENLKRRRQAELKHGRIAMLAMRGYITRERPAAELAFRRLAMMTIIGTFFQNGLTGSAWGDWATFTASPLSALDKDLGVRAPVGFRDPICFTTNGNVENFNIRRRANGSSEPAWGDRDSFTASPLRTFKSEPSMQATAGFWNPTGFTADGSVETIKLDTKLANSRLATIAILSTACAKRVRSNRLGMIGAASRPRL
jgi:hypothetical protein